MFHTGYRYFPFQEITLHPEQWPVPLSGLRIVQLSDLHLHRNVAPEYLETLIARVNDLAPDLVLFTGDMIEAKAYAVKKQLMLFGKLKAPAYYVTGNHDIYYGPKALADIFRECGIVALDNRYERVTYNGVPFQLAGLSDRYSFMRGIRRPIQTLFSAMDAATPTILLAHQPKDVELIGEQRVDLQLSGHTHGGQLFPFTHLVRLLQPYMHGSYQVGKTTLYVTTGLGYWGLPIRYKAAPEIPLITVNSKRVQ